MTFKRLIFKCTWAQNFAQLLFELCRLASETVKFRFGWYFWLYNSKYSRAIKSILSSWMSNLKQNSCYNLLQKLLQNLTPFRKQFKFKQKINQRKALSQFPCFFFSCVVYGPTKNIKHALQSNSNNITNTFLKIEMSNPFHF